MVHTCAEIALVLFVVLRKEYPSGIYANNSFCVSFCVTNLNQEDVFCGNGRNLFKQFVQVLNRRYGNI